MKNLINALMQLHYICQEEAKATVIQMMREVDEGYNPIEILEENGLSAADQWDLQDCYINY